jgi:hypothetical protein
VPLPTALGILPSLLYGSVRHHFPTVMWGRVKLCHLVTSNMLDGDTAQLLSGVPDGVSCCLKGSQPFMVMTVLPLAIGLTVVQAPHTAVWMHTLLMGMAA